MQRFAEINNFKNVFQPKCNGGLKTNYYLKGKWKKEVFQNNHPIVLEIGCGKGEYSVGMARKFPNKNFIGLDIKGARIWKGAKTALEENLNNVAFVRSKAELLETIFNSNEIEEIWLTFPDPQMKKTNKRLSCTNLLKIYSKLLTKNGFVHLKTDSRFLYKYTLFVIKENELKIDANTDNLYNSDISDEIRSIKTFYELQFLKKEIPIKYLKFATEKRTEFTEPDVEIEPDSYRSFGRLQRVQAEKINTRKS